MLVAIESRFISTGFSDQEVRTGGFWGCDTGSGAGDGGGTFGASTGLTTGAGGGGGAFGIGLDTGAAGMTGGGGGGAATVTGALPPQPWLQPSLPLRPRTRPRALRPRHRSSHRSLAWLGNGLGDRHDERRRGRGFWTTGAGGGGGGGLASAGFG